MIPLNQNNLIQIGGQQKTPSYDRKKLRTGIVHIGVGGFHRSHQAYYMHQLLLNENNYQWGICGVGIREADRKMYETLQRQDGLYTLIIQHPSGHIESVVIGSIQDMLLAVDTPSIVIDKMANSETKIVSLTITEGGYNFNPTNGEFDFEHADIQHDLNNRKQPKTVFGYLAYALRLRMEKNIPPFTVLSCDNIQHNGNIARRMLLAFAERQDPKLAAWIAEKVAFPNTMVDRITPVTSDVDATYLQDTYGIRDDWPVICEPFIQWVIEDKFSDGRPPLEVLGVQFVDDVAPYETMKIRLLNAGHSVLGIPGAIHGHETINDCMADAVFAKFMREFMNHEVTPSIGTIEGIDLEEYKDKIEERFANPNIKDQVSRICSESSAKLPKFLLPTIEENLASGGSIKYATFLIAAWSYYCDKGVDENNQPLEIIDVMQSTMHEAAIMTKDNPLAFLNVTQVFGKLNQNKRFCKKYIEIILLIYKTQNIRHVMEEISAS